jgi:hypothetical protein
LTLTRNLAEQRKSFPAPNSLTDLNDINQPDLSHDKQRTTGESSTKLSEKNAFPIRQKWSLLIALTLFQKRRCIGGSLNLENFCMVSFCLCIIGAVTEDLSLLTSSAITVANGLIGH